jgi:hypothetical protein
MGRPVSGITGSAGTVVEVELVVAVELLDEDEVVLALVVGAGSVIGVVAPAEVAELELSLLHAASASAAIMNVEIGLVYFTGLSALQCALSSWGGPDQCYRVRNKSVVMLT